MNHTSIPGAGGVSLACRSDETVLTSGALGFLADLTRRFRPALDALLRARGERQARLDRGESLGFLPETAPVREGAWTVAPLPEALRDRRVEITGPPERKMLINALNSGARVYMADFEDSLAPTLENLLDGQRNLMEAVRGTLSHVDRGTGKVYAQEPGGAALMVRPRGLHLPERNLEVDGAPVPAPLFAGGRARPLPAQAGAPPGGEVVERGAGGHGGRPGPAPGHGAHDDARGDPARGLPDG